MAGESSDPPPPRVRTRRRGLERAPATVATRGSRRRARDRPTRRSCSRRGAGLRGCAPARRPFQASHGRGRDDRIQAKGAAPCWVPARRGVDAQMHGMQQSDCRPGDRGGWRAAQAQFREVGPDIDDGLGGRFVPWARLPLYVGWYGAARRTFGPRGHRLRAPPSPLAEAVHESVAPRRTSLTRV